MTGRLVLVTAAMGPRRGAAVSDAAFSLPKRGCMQRHRQISPPVSFSTLLQPEGLVITHIFFGLALEPLLHRTPTSAAANHAGSFASRASHRADVPGIRRLAPPPPVRCHGSNLPQAHRTYPPGSPVRLVQIPLHPPAGRAAPAPATWRSATVPPPPPARPPVIRPYTPVPSDYLPPPFRS